MSAPALLAEKLVEMAGLVGNGHLSRGDDCALDLILDEEFRHLLPQHSPEEKAALKRDILRDEVCLAPLVVWKETGILLDGYTRLEICTREGIPYRIEALPFPDRAAARAWVLGQQSGRRNLTENGLGYVRGKRYLVEKQPHGGQRPKSKGSGQEEPGFQQAEEGSGHYVHSLADSNVVWSGHTDSFLRTERRLGREYGVTDRPIRRDADFAAAVDAIVANCGQWAKALLVSPEAKTTRKDAERLAALGPADQRRLLDALRLGGEALPWKDRPPTASMRVPLETEGLLTALLTRLGPERLEELARRLPKFLESSKSKDDTTNRRRA